MTDTIPGRARPRLAATGHLPAEPAVIRSRRRLVLVAVVILLGGFFLLQNASQLGAPFGESHDGRNGGVWAIGARAMRQDGLIESRLGARSSTAVYANHPPGILVETYLAEQLAGEHRIVTRAPAWLASLASLGLLVVLLREAGFTRGATAAGLVAVATSAMFLVYGSMLDTPVTSLPFSLAVLLAAQRVVDGRPPPPWVLAAGGLAAAVSGWQSLTFAGAATLWILAGARRDRSRLRASAALAGGAAVGLLLTLGWVWWAYGSLAPLTSRAGMRVNEVSMGASSRAQLTFLRDLVPVAGPLGAVGLVLAMASDRRRGLALVATGSVVSYAVAFRQGAYIHDYWNYAIIVALAVGSASVAEAFTERAPELHQRAAVLGGALVLVLGALSATLPSAARDTRELGGGVADLLAVAERHGGPGEALVAVRITAGQAPSWLRYEHARPVVELTGPADLAALATERPDLPVLLAGSRQSPEARARLEADALASEPPWLLITARDAHLALAEGD